MAKKTTKKEQKKLVKKKARIQRYLEEHSDLAVNVLRSSPQMATVAMQSFLMQSAADAERTTTQYPTLGHLGTSNRQSISMTLPKVTPYNLRRFSEFAPSRRGINALTNPILDMSWEIKLRKTNDLSDFSTADPTDEQRQRIDIATCILEEPNEDESWRVYLEQIIEDVIVGGYGASEVVKTDDPDKPIDLYTVDGQTIRMNTLWKSGSDEPRYSQSVGYAGLTFGGYDDVKLQDEQLIYFRLNPRTNTPFGYGYLETAFVFVNAFMGAFEYSERRASNATPQEILFLGENVDITTVRRWQQYWEQEIEGYGKVPIIGGGRAPSVLSMTGTGEDQLWIKWQEFLIRVIAMSFGLSSQKFALEKDINRSTAETQTNEDWETVAPIAGVIKDHFTRLLLWKTLGWHDLEFAWIMHDADEKRQAEIMETRYQANSITVDEMRRVHGDPPLENGLGQWTKTPYEALSIMTLEQQLPAYGGPPLEDSSEEETFPGDITEEDMPENMEDLLGRAHEVLQDFDSNGQEKNVAT